MRTKMIYASMFLFLFSFFQVDGYTRPAKEYVKILGGNPEGSKDILPFIGRKDLMCPRGSVKGTRLSNPYADDKKLFTINYKNVDKYKHRLTPGQIMRIKRNKKFAMHVFPSRRNVIFPESYYTKTQKNRKTCRFDKNGNLAGFHGGVPFPSPKNGVEAAWNMKKYWTGDDVKMDDTRRVVSPSGRIKKELLTTKVLLYDETRLGRPMRNSDKIKQKIVQTYNYPADIAGQTILIFKYIDDRRPDDQWLYLPTLRRVRRAPAMTRGAQIDGEATMDELGGGFTGLVNDWNWKLIGKKDIYIAANNYDMWKLGGKDKDECWTQDINPARIRNELRRCWVIEGTLKKGLNINHPYSKRVEYVDEDTWMFATGDRYDRRGNLWRINVYYTSYDYCQRFRMVNGYIHLNLESGRYELYGGSRTKDSIMAAVSTNIDPKEFTIQALRRAGR